MLLVVSQYQPATALGSSSDTSNSARMVPPTMTALTTSTMATTAHTEKIPRLPFCDGVPDQTTFSLETFGGNVLMRVSSRRGMRSSLPE